MSHKIDPIVFITEIIKGLLQINSGILSGEDKANRTTYVDIKKGQNDYRVVIPTAYLRNLENASEHENSEQFVVFKNDIEFKICAQLLKQNALPHSFCMSEKIINEKRIWIKKDISFNNVIFEPKLQRKFYEGLIKSKKYLKFKTKMISSAIMEEEKNNVKELLKFYEQNKTFYNNKNVSVEMLGFLKASLVCEIIDFEEKRKEIQTPVYLEEKHDNIYSLVDILRDGNGLLNIELPYFIIEYASDIKTKKFNPLDTNEDIVSFASNKMIFLARKFNDTDSDNMKQIIEKEFTKEGFIIVEGKVEDCGYVTEDILEKIKKSGFFLALITPVSEFKSGKFSASAWVLMEIGSAVAYDRKVMVLADNSVDTSEYESKLQRDCQYEPFSKGNLKSALEKVVDRIKNEYQKMI